MTRNLIFFQIGLGNQRDSPEYKWKYWFLHFILLLMALWRTQPPHHHQISLYLNLHSVTFDHKSQSQKSWRHTHPEGNPTTMPAGKADTLTVLLSGFALSWLDMIRTWLAEERLLILICSDFHHSVYEGGRAFI